MEERIEKLVEMIESGDVKGFLDDIDQIAASQAYIIIRDNIKPAHIKAIRESGTEDYQKFQDIKLRAKQSWDYDHKSATMLDVNKACMNVYTLMLKIMKIHNDSYDEKLNKICNAINRIEEKVGLECTTWEDESTDNSIDGGNDNVDVQGIKEDI